MHTQQRIIGGDSAGRASWENAKDATADTGRYLAGRAGAAVGSGDRRAGKLFCEL